MKCAAHSEVETNLSCGRCGVAICPRCMVQTPVGARCRKCAGLRRLPTYEITPQHYLRALGVGLGLSIVLGIVWGLLWPYVPWLILDVLLAAGVGYAVGEVLGLSVNRKRGRVLEVIGGLCVVFSYVVANVGLYAGELTFFASFGWYDPLLLAVGIVVAVVRLH